MTLPLEQLLIQTVNGIVNGLILALVASGLTLRLGEGGYLASRPVRRETIEGVGPCGASL